MITLLDTHESTAASLGHRSCSPEETLDRIRPAFPIAGITRLANITGLDRIGIPVVSAIRPNSATLSTSAGKGLTLNQAKTSAAMEALELFCAETIAPSIVRQSYRQVASLGARLQIADSLLRPQVNFDEEWSRDWVFGSDWFSADPVIVPFRLVNLCLPQNAYDFPIFQSSSNGLASGNTREEAILSGLLELLERDAVTCFDHRWYGQVPPQIALDSVESPSLRSVIQCLQEAEIRVVLQDCTSDLQVPVFRARLLDEAFPALGVYHGQAAHLDPDIAALKAVLEAVQSRAVYIAGSRDDCFHEEWRLLRKTRYTEAALEARSPHPDLPFPSHGRAVCGNSSAAISEIAIRLRVAGFPQLVVVDVSRPDIPISAANVIVPALEGYMLSSYRATGRAKGNIQ